MINLYPAPKYAKIIEPFAGSARYALKYWDRDVLLVDCREVVIKTWHYLQQASLADILALPEPKKGDDLAKFNLSEGERFLLGWQLGRGATHPRGTIQKFSYLSRDKATIANQLYKIKHWTIRLGSYLDIENEACTWFIDPPYLHGGKSYRTGQLDYPALANWCKSRLGQVIVCENTKADWLPFWGVGNLAGAQARSTEAMWCNDLSQSRLFR